MNKTPQELAEEYVEDHDECEFARENYLAGYEAAAPKWISVKDRLPDIYEEVIVAVPFWFEDESGPTKKRGCCIRTARLMSEREGAKWSVHIEDKWTTNITHWMPLPNPPENPDSSNNSKS